MKCLSSSPVKSILLAASISLSLVSASAAQGDWVSLYNGKDLEGWTQKNGLAHYDALPEGILGTSVPDSPNSFLCTKKTYGNFELEFEVKVDRELNSGVQIRSESKPDKDNGRVHGYQVEIAVNGFSGGVYDEGRRGKFLNTEGATEEIRKLVKDNTWAKYRIVCQQNRIQVWVNDVQVTDLTDDMTSSGFIGLQVHGVGARTEPLKVMWRNLRVREL
jgi:hypothetical protein